MKVSKDSAILMAVYCGFGVLTGLVFGRANYHKGQRDAYEEIANDLNKINEEVEEMLEKGEA